MRTLVIGIGNTLLSDDGVGIVVAKRIRERIESVDIAEVNTVGIPLLDYISGYDKVIFIDSATMKDIPTGTVQEFSLEEIKKSYPFMTHGVNLPLTIEFGKRCGEDVPADIKIYGIGTRDTTTFSENCTGEVEKAIPGIVDYIIENEFMRGSDG